VDNSSSYLLLILRQTKFVVPAALSHQFLVRAAFHNLTVADKHYLRAVAYCGKPVGDDKRGAAFH